MRAWERLSQLESWLAKNLTTTELAQRNVLRALHEAGVPEPMLEHPFVEGRRWRFDYAWPHLAIALEYDGATWGGGRHTRGSGHETDARKRNVAQMLGWRVLVFSEKMLRSGELKRTVERFINRGECWIE